MKLRFPQGSTAAYSVQVFEPDGVTPVDLTLATAVLPVLGEDGSAASQVFALSQIAGILITNAALGQLTFEFQPSNTNAATGMVPERTYYWSLQITSQSGEVGVPLSGTLVLSTNEADGS